MSNGKIVIDHKELESLADELTSVGRQMVSIGKRIEKIASNKDAKSVKVTKKSHPELFDKKFIKSIKDARKEFEKGESADYFEFRKTLDL